MCIVCKNYEGDTQWITVQLVRCHGGITKYVLILY